MQLKDELDQLKRELALMREEQQSRQNHIDQSLVLFSDKLSLLEQRVTDHSLSAEKSHINSVDTQEVRPKNTPYDWSSGKHSEVSECSNQPSMQPEVASEQMEPLKVSEVPDSQAITKQEGIHHTLNSASAVFQQYAESAFSPMLHLMSKAKSFYDHYQRRGLAAVFLMTLAGIITLTLGFSYLLQYSFHHWLSEIGKVSFAFVAANVLLALGVFIYKRRDQMQDYASGLVGLGLILNYVSAYFSGPYFQLLPNWLSFLLLFLITLGGFFLSFKFETRVVALLSLVGGSVAPIMLFSEANDQIVYLPYLLLIGGCAVLQGRFLRWPLLIEVTTFVHIACVELFIVSQSVYFSELTVMAVIALFSINLMLYLYGFGGLKIANQSQLELLCLNKRLLVLPIALLAFTLLTISQISPFAGLVFVVNACLLGGAYFYVKQRSDWQALILFLTGSFAGFAALLLAQQELLGVVLFLQGLGLLYLGCKEHYRSVRFEAYTLFVLGLISHSYTLFNMVSLSSLRAWHWNESGMVLLYLSLSAIALYAMVYLLRQSVFNEQVGRIETQLFTLFRECLNINYVLLACYIAIVSCGEYAVNLVPLISVLLLYLARKDRLIFSEVFAWLMLLPLLGAVLFGVMEVQSTYFEEQPVYAQLARIELFACLVGFYYWYQRFYAASKALKIAQWFQIACLFVLPLVFLSKVIREYPEFLSLALSVSCLASLLLAWVTRRRLLIVESQVLTCVAIIAIALSCLLSLWQGMVALCIGALLLFVLHRRYAQLANILQLVLRVPWVLSPYYFALVLVVVVHTLMNLVGLENWGIAMAVVVVYFAHQLKANSLPLVLKRSYPTSCLFLVIPPIMGLIFHWDNGLAISLNSLLFMAAQSIILLTLRQFYQANSLTVRWVTTKIPRLYLECVWHLVLVVSYLLWSYQFSPVIAAPLSAIVLVIHGSCLMFVSLKVGQEKIIKLAAGLFTLACGKVLLVDMANFLMIQKVVAFILIGGILLSVSYFYQKRKNRHQLGFEANT